MKTLFAIYVTDSWLTNSSKYLISIVDAKYLIVYQINEYIKKNELEKLSNYDLSSLSDIFQTQGRTENFCIDKIILNELID